MKKTNFTNLSTPNLGIQSSLGKSQQNTKSAAAIFTNAPLEKKGPWLCAFKDPLATLKTVSACIKLGDVKGDGEARLLIADQNQKFMIYKGINIETEYNLLDVPIALSLFYSDISKNPLPNIAIVCESAVYIYKNLKPYFKFVLPSVEITKEENEIWAKYPEIDQLAELIQALNKTSHDAVFPLSYKSTDLITCQDFEEQKQIFENYKGMVSIPNMPTCVTTIKKSSEEETALSQLILGTELRTVLLFDIQGTSIVKKIILPSVPVNILTHGILETEYKLIVACRDDRVYFIRNGELENTIIDLESKTCGIIKLDKTIYVASMDKTIHAYNFKGIKVFSLHLNANILAVEALEFGKSKQVKGILVALSSMEIRLYKEKQLIYSLINDDVVLGMKFGYYGREDGCLISVFKTKGIDVKILQRQFTFSGYIQKNGNTIEAEEDIPLNIPKKTKLFLEDTQRERDQSNEIHRNFQKDLVKMRLKTAQSFYNMLSNGLGPVTTNYGSNLRLHSSIIGLGPNFTVHIDVENVSSKPISDLYITVNYDSLIYKLLKMPKKIPLLIPNISYPIDIILECIDANGVNDSIKVFLCDKKKDMPLLGAMIQMPLSELAVN